MKTIYSISDRWNAPTPPFFRKLRNIGLIVAGIGAALITAPGPIPEFLIEVAGYLITAGAVVTSISQITIPHDEDQE